MRVGKVPRRSTLATRGIRLRPEEISRRIKIISPPHPFPFLLPRPRPSAARKDIYRSRSLGSLNARGPRQLVSYSLFLTYIPAHPWTTPPESCFSHSCQYARSHFNTRHPPKSHDLPTLNSFLFAPFPLLPFLFILFILRTRQFYATHVCRVLVAYL